MKKRILSSLAAALLAITGSVQAAEGEPMDLSALAANVNASNAGVELIVPKFTISASGVTFYFRIMKPNTGSTGGAALYSTTAKSMSFPSLSGCGTGNTPEYDIGGVKFLRFGNYAVAGIDLNAWCYNQGNLSADNTYVYIVDVSASGKTPKLLSFTGKGLFGLNLTGNNNGKGSTTDLMISSVTESDASMDMTVSFYDFSTGSTYSTNIATVASAN